MVERYVLGFVVVLGGVGCAEDQQAFMLDNICRSQAAFFVADGRPLVGCTLSGDAVLTTGIASNATAVKLGPAGGSISLALAMIPAASQATWSFDALVYSTRPEGSVLGRPQIDWGSCGITCPGTIAGVEVDLTEDIHWAVVVDSVPGTANPTGQFNQGVIPGDAVITLQGADIVILDVRTPGFDENAFAGFAFE